MDLTYLEVTCKSALNRVQGMDFEWSLNPYTGCAHRCTFCYVRAFERRADRPSDDRYGRTVRVKVNFVEVLRSELARPSWRRDWVAIGAATDPYQPAESRYRLTRGTIEALSAHRNPFGIITRGTMILRDLDVLQEASRRAEVSINFSIPTLDARVWKKTEPGTPPPRQRLRVLRALVEGGVRAGVALAPILPGISDHPEQLAEVVRAARDHGATHLWGRFLYLRPGTREHFLENLARDWPDLLPMYEQLYDGRAYLGKDVVGPVRREVADLRQRFEIADRRRVRLLPAPGDPLPDTQLELAITDAPPDKEAAEPTSAAIA